MTAAEKCGAGDWLRRSWDSSDPDCLSWWTRDGDACSSHRKSASDWSAPAPRLLHWVTSRRIDPAGSRHHNHDRIRPHRKPPPTLRAAWRTIGHLGHDCVYGPQKASEELNGHIAMNRCIFTHLIKWPAGAARPVSPAPGRCHPSRAPSQSRSRALSMRITWRFSCGPLPTARPARSPWWSWLANRKRAAARILQR